MQPVLSVEAVKAVEQEWADSHEGSTWPLMATAGQAVAALAQRRWSNARCIWVLAGRGNNGGDGYVAARHLLERGLHVVVIAPSGAPRSGGDAHRAWREFVEQGGESRPDLPDEPADLVIDAVIGTGHRGALKAGLAELFESIRARRPPVLAIDMPSGLEGATGQADPHALRASVTLSFIAFKPGQLTGSGPSMCGELELESLGVPVDAVGSGWSWGRGVYLDRAPAWPERPADCHKGRFGTVRVVAGASGMGGAGLLAARAALHAGAGRVVWHTDPENARVALAAQPELMSAPADPESVPDDAVCVLGPGLGLDDAADALYQSLLGRPLQQGVLDADGLTWLSRQPKPVPGWVLTPHPGEAARLLHVGGKDVQADRCRAAVDLSERYQTTVVLKGAGSLVATEGRLVFCHPGTPAMATPGMGDVLAGLVASLMAQGLAAESAARTGVWWHAKLATDIATGRRLVLATDLIERLGFVDQESG